jgi:hypothetical protein
MTRKIITILLLALTLGAVQSCEDAFSKDIIIDVPRQPDRLVVISNTPVGERFSVFVTKSVDVLAPNNNIGGVTTAFVTLFLGNTLVDTLVYNSSTRLYTAKNNTRPIPGLTYIIRASLPGLTTVEGTIQVPLPVPISSFSYRPRFRIGSNGAERDEIRLGFQDLSTEGNFYLVKVRIPLSFGPGVPTYNDLYCVYTVDPDAENNAGELSTSYDECVEGSFVMKDTRFNGRLKEVTLQVNSFDMNIVTVGGITYRPIVELQAITPEYYRYFKSQKLYESAQGNPFAEPVTVYTNIRDGYGIFTIHSSSTRVIQ